MSGDEECAGLRPGGRMLGSCRVPTSKSLAQRALLCGALARGDTRLVALPDGEDVRFLCEALGAWGVSMAPGSPGELLISGRPPDAAAEEAAAGRSGTSIDIGESGTAGRLICAILGLCATPGHPLEIRARGSLLRRTSPALFRALESAGVGVEPLGIPRGWPVRLRPTAPPDTVLLENPTSSQEVSGLAIALASRPGPYRLIVKGELPSKPYLDMTLAVLRSFGAQVAETQEEGDYLLELRGPLRAPAAALAIEPDASGAAVALAAACLGGGEVRIPGFAQDSPQGDLRIVEHLRAFGCHAGLEAGALWSRGAPLRGAELDLSREPDLAPVLAAVAGAVAVQCGEASLLEGLGTLPGKESSRIEVLAEGLAAIGLGTEHGPEHLRILPRAGAGRAPAHRLDPRGDHRMAFAFALLGLCTEGVRVSNPQCVAKSWPSFWSDLQVSGVRALAVESTDGPDSDADCSSSKL